MFKRIVSLLLALVMMAGMVPVHAFGTEAQTTADTGNMTIEGTNALGDLLTEEITAYQDAQLTAQEEYEPGFSVTDLVFSGATATVTYDAMEEATLVVAVYTEDGLTLLNSAYKTVSPDATTATVTLSGSMPTYFYAAAYLLNSFDMSPLCQNYSTPIYTQAMQELLASTTADYPADRVLNLDDDRTTNFAVYAEGTTVIDNASGVNTVTSANDDTMTYVISNADEQFTSLQPGDVVAYEYGNEQYLFAKVGSISIEGTTVTIHGTEVDVDDVFSHVKMEGIGDSEDAIIDDSTASEGITYAGDSGASPFGFGRSVEDDAFQGTISKKVPFIISDGVLNGKLTFGVDVNFAFLKASDYFYTKLTTDTTLVLDANVEGKYKPDPLRLGKWQIPFAYGGLSLVCEPEFKVEISAKLAFTASVSATIGFSFETDKDFQEIRSTPKLTTEISVEGTVFIGFDLHPKVEVAKGFLLDIGAELPIGVEITAKYSAASAEFGEEEHPNERHACENCLEIKFSFKADFKIGIEVIKMLHKEYHVVGVMIPIGDAYYSFDYKKFDWGKCPYKEYLVSVQVLDHADFPVAGAYVTATGGKVSEEGQTNANGVTSVYLPQGEYAVKAFTERLRATDSVKVKEARTVILRLPEPPDEGETLPPDVPEETTPAFPGGILGSVESTPVVNYGAPGVYEYFGEQGNNLKWEFFPHADIYPYGTLRISGSGEVTEDAWFDDMFHWYEEYGYATSVWPLVKYVIVEEGITGVGTSLNQLDNAVKITLPSTVTRIEDSAFASTNSLQEINIPSTVTYIGEYAFQYCGNLTEITIPGSVEKIGRYAFGWAGLERITLEDGIKTVSDGMFSACYDLVSVKLPSTLEVIGNSAFSSCSSLEKINIPDSVKEVGSSAFAYSNLKSVRIPDQVRTLSGTFYNCGNLSSVVLNDGLQYLGYSCFENCTSLTEITIPSSVYYINSAFSGCTNLTSVIFADVYNPAGLTLSIDEWAFSGCEKLTEINLPARLNSMTGNAFWGCNNLEYIRFNDALDIVDNRVYYNKDGVYTGEEEFAEVFPGLTAKAYYPWEYAEENKDSHYSYDYRWNKEKMKTVGSQLTWIPYTVDEAGNMIPDESKAYCANPPEEVLEENAEAADAVETVPQETAPEETVPMETVPAETAPTETVPEVTVPEETVREETVPVETDPVETLPEGTEEVLITETQPAETVAEEETQPLTLTGLFFRRPGFLTAAPAALAEEVIELLLPEETAESETEPAGTEPVQTEAAEETLPPETIPAETNPAETESENLEADAPAYDAIFGGDYSSEILDSYILKTASFSGLVPGEEYLLLALTSVDTTDPLSNLIHIDQGTASARGTLSFDYVEQEEYSVSYVMACGPSNKDLNDAVITFPRVYASDGEQIIKPTVKYQGKTLKEDLEYTLGGKVSFSTPGQYTCYIRGIYNYTGTVQCTYTVEEKPLPKIRIEGSTGMMAASTTTLTADFSFAPDEGTQVTWSLAEGDEAYAKIEANGNEATVAAYFATEQHTITVLASAPGKAEPAQHEITIYPREGGALTESIKLYICYYDMEGNEYLTDLSTSEVWYYQINEWMVNGFGVSLKAVAAPEGAGTEFLWSTSDPSIATVSDYGFVNFTGAAGKVVITAEALDGTGISASAAFETRLPGGVEIQGDSDIRLLGGKSTTLKVIDQDTGKAVKAKDIVWTLDAGEQDASAFATISKSGKLTTKKVVSRADLRVYGEVYNNGNYVDTVVYTVSVYPAAAQVEIFNGTEMVNGKTIPVDTNGEVTLPKLTAKVYPTDAMEEVTWKSSSKKIVEIDPDTGELTWKGKNGTVTITATANDGSKKKATVKLTFGTLAEDLTIGIKNGKQITAAEEAEVISGKSLQLAAELTGSPTNKKVTWSLENTADSAYVKLSASGKVTARTVYEERTVVIKATAADGSGAADTFTVKILPKDAGILILKQNGKNVTKATVYADMNKGGTAELTAHNLNSDEIPTVEWKSSKTAIATVENGIVTFRKPGTVTITATDVNDGRKATVTVKASALASRVTITGAKEVASGKAVTLKATTENASSSKVTWSITEGSQYARITNKGKLTANKDITSAKTAVVRATASDGSGTYGEYTVTIRPIAQGVQIYSIDEATGTMVLDVDSDDSGSFFGLVRSNTNFQWAVTTLETDGGYTEKLQLNANVYPYEQNTALNAIQGVTWKSSSKKVAAVDENGLVTCLKAGSTTITATASDGSGKKATFKLTVVKKTAQILLEDSYTVTAGKKLTLKPVLLAADGTAPTDKRVEYKITGGDGAEYTAVSQKGVLTTKKSGASTTVEVTVTALDGSGVSKTCTVEIRPA